MSMKMIRQTHGVPAKRGQRVRFTLEGSAPRLGTIRSADGGMLYVQLDGDGFTRGLLQLWVSNIWSLNNA